MTLLAWTEMLRFQSITYPIKAATIKIMFTDLKIVTQCDVIFEKGLYFFRFDK